MTTQEVIQAGEWLVEGIKEALGIESPSKKLMEEVPTAEELQEAFYEGLYYKEPG